MILFNDGCALHTARLLLRPLRLDDAAPLFALFNNWNVVRFLSSPPWPYTQDDAEWFVRSAVSHAAELNEEVLAITRDGIFVGVIGVRFRGANALQRGAGPNVGYWIGEPFWGQGLMTEAVRAFVRHIFVAADASAIYSGAFTQNAASLRVQEKAGFVRRRRYDAVLQAAWRRISAREHGAETDRTLARHAGGMAGGRSRASLLSRTKM